MVMWMEQDVLRRLAGESGSGCSSGGDGGSRIKKDAVCSGVALAATTRNWWSQLKTAGAAIYANRHYLALRQQRQRLLQRESIDLPLPSPVKCRLATSDPKGGYSTIGNVYVHPSAQVHPTALVSYPLFHISYSFLIKMFNIFTMTHKIFVIVVFVNCF